MTWIYNKIGEVDRIVLRNAPDRTLRSIFSFDAYAERGARAFRIEMGRLLGARIERGAFTWPENKARS